MFEFRIGGRRGWRFPRSDKQPVALTVEYASLSDGPFYAARTVLSAPQKDLRVTIETFDYTRSAGQ